MIEAYVRRPLRLILDQAAVVAGLVGLVAAPVALAIALILATFPNPVAVGAVALLMGTAGVVGVLYSALGLADLARQHVDGTFHGLVGTLRRASAGVWRFLGASVLLAAVSSALAWAGPALDALGLPVALIVIVVLGGLAAQLALSYVGFFLPVASLHERGPFADMLRSAIRVPFRGGPLRATAVVALASLVVVLPLLVLQLALVAPIALGGTHASMSAGTAASIVAVTLVLVVAAAVLQLYMTIALSLAYLDER